ncbi:hypothetical protein WDW37_10710 [Bdellovibrionota bacterium FG-1]
MTIEAAIAADSSLGAVSTFPNDIAVTRGHDCTQACGIIMAGVTGLGSVDESWISASVALMADFFEWNPKHGFFEIIGRRELFCHFI